MMTDASVDPAVQDDLAVCRRRTASRLKRARLEGGQRVSIAANVIAAIASFLILILAPTLLWQFIPIPDDYVTALVRFVPITLEDRITSAFGLALLFFVVGIGLQAWQYRKRIASWWPLVLAFPVVAVLLVPDVLAGGGSIGEWAMFGSAIVLAFWVHWLAVLVAVELID